MNIRDVATLVEKHCNGIEPTIVMAVIEKESSFNEDAIGKSEDKGLMQLTPIALEHLKQMGYEVSDVMKPENNIKLGCAYLKYIYDTLKSKEVNTNLDFWALCAYNSGITYIINCIEKGIKPSNWQYAIDIISKVKKHKKFFER